MLKISLSSIGFGNKSIFFIFVIFVLNKSQVSSSLSSESVVKYNSDQFFENIPKRNHYVLYFNPWNTGSKRLSLEWEEMGQVYNSEDSNLDVIITKVDCSIERDLCEYEDIVDFPTVKLYRNRLDKGLNVEIIKYRGVYDFDSLEQFLNYFINPKNQFVGGTRVEKVPDPIRGLHRLIDENFSNALYHVPHSFINFCTDWSSNCQKFEKMWKNLAYEFALEDNYITGLVDCTKEIYTCKNNQISKYPTLLWFTNASIAEKIAGPKEVPSDFEDLKDLVNVRLGKKFIDNIQAWKSKGIEPLVHLSNENFDKVLGEEKLLFIFFMTPWCSECEALNFIWEEISYIFASKAVSDLISVKIAKLDCTRNKDFCHERGFIEYPTISLYKDGILDQNYFGPYKTEDLNVFITKAAGVNNMPPISELLKDEL